MTWIARLPVDRFDALGTLRCTPGVEIAKGDEHCWLRGTALSPDVERTLRSIPDARLFEPHDDALRPVGKRVATSLLPSDFSEPFRPIRDAFPMTIDAHPALDRPEPRAHLSFTRAVRHHPPNMIRVPARLWYDFATTTSQLRLDGLRFAATRDEAVIEGTPLPPLNGRRYAVRHGVATPLGLRWAPLDAPELVARTLELQPGEVALFDEPDQYLRLGTKEWVAATRSAVRTTWSYGFDE